MASGYEIDAESFNVNFENVYGSLSIEFTLCASTEPAVSSLLLVIKTENDGIDWWIKQGMEESFGEDGDVMTVAISVMKKFSGIQCPHRICCHGAI